MSLVTTYNLGKSFDPIDIFAGLSLSIPHGARIAIELVYCCGRKMERQVMKRVDVQSGYKRKVCRDKS